MEQSWEQMGGGRYQKKSVSYGELLFESIFRISLRKSFLAKSKGSEQSLRKFHYTTFIASNASNYL